MKINKIYYNTTFNFVDSILTKLQEFEFKFDNTTLSEVY